MHVDQHYYECFLHLIFMARQCTFLSFNDFFKVIYLFFILELFILIVIICEYESFINFSMDIFIIWKNSNFLALNKHDLGLNFVILHN